MTEWILVITLHLALDKPQINNYQTEIVDGFSTEQKCLDGAEVLGSQISNQILNHRAAMGIDLDTKKGKPIVFTACKKVTK